MDRISAADNLQIDTNDGWRLISTGLAQEHTLLEIVPGQAIRYIPAFASQRRLPTTGELPLNAVQRVALGWSNDDEAWHLGMVLVDEIAKQRGSRWCELAAWPDPDTTLFQELSSGAGRDLARTLNCPFNFLPAVIQPKQEAPAPPPLPELPRKLNGWVLMPASTPSAIQFTRLSVWSRERVRQIIWYSLLIVVYLALSLATLTKRIALPKPEILPYMGLATALVLLIIILYRYRQLRSQPNRLLLNSDTRTMTAMLGSHPRWQKTADDLEAVYVSQTINIKGEKRTIQHAELNLLLRDGTFMNLYSDFHAQLDTQMPVGKPLDDELKALMAELPADDIPVSTLTVETAYTDLQVVGLWMAQTLGVACRYDERREK